MTGRYSRSIIFSFILCAYSVFFFCGSAFGSDMALPGSISPQQIQQMIQSVPGVTSSMQEIQTVPTFESIEVSGDNSGQDQAESIGQEINSIEKDTFSSIEQLYRQQYDSPLAQSLQQYGYNLFDSATNSFSRLAIPRDDYVIGPGDKLRIRIWGNGKDAAYTGTVSRDGTIDAPQIGIVPIAGTPFGQLEEIFRKEAEKYVQGFNINVTLAELRSVEIYVVGEVHRPGLHLVPPFSTAMTGLIAGDGVKKSGSLRLIRVLRDGKLLQVVDLYSLLLRGSRQGDVPLQDGDVLFVPRVGPTAAIAGATIQPAIYELTSEKTVADLMELAGGVMPQTYTDKLLLRRFVNNEEFVIQDIDRRTGEIDFDKIPILNGDLLEMQSLGAAWPEVVRLEGNVWFPDVFNFRSGLKLSDVLSGQALLKPNSITEFALLHHYDQQTTRYRVERFPLTEVFSGKYDAMLSPYDKIEILARADYDMKEPIKLVGSVWKPGEYVYTPGITLGDIFGMAGGFKFDADRERIDLSRQDVKNGEVVTSHISLDSDIDAAFRLQPYDYVYVRRVKDAASFKSASIAGEVKFPGEYRIMDGERLSDLIERAGGFTENAYFYGAYFTSESAREIQQASINKMIDDLELRVQTVLADQSQLMSGSDDKQLISGQQMALQKLVSRLREIKASGRMSITLGPLASLKDTALDFEIQDGASLHIPQRPNFVSVVGSVFSPNSFLYMNGMKLNDYLGKAGGPTKTADAESIYVVKANGEVMAATQQQGLFKKFGSSQLMPGDTIVVPEDLERIPYLKLVRDISDIIFKIATTAGIIFAI